MFLILNFIIHGLLNSNKAQRIQIALDSNLKNLETHYKVILHNQKISADATYKSTINRKEVITILSQANQEENKQKLNILREKLKTILTEKYNILKVKGVLQYHFVLPDNTVFLRMHKPLKFGDDLTNIRADFKYVNKYKKSVHGFTQGRTAHGFRNSYPILDDDGKHLGAMEISYSSEILQEQLTNISQIHTHFLVNKNIFSSRAWKRDDLVLKYLKSAENDDFMITMTNNHTPDKCIIENSKNLQPIKNTIKTNMEKGDKFSIYTLHHGKHIDSFSFYPVEDVISNKIVAWLVEYDENNKFIKMTIETAKIINIASFIVLFILFYFIYRVLNQKELLNSSVKEKTKELDNLNKNLELKVNEEVEKNKMIQEKLFQSKRLASMGEMIGNIAHQWRQPLSVISTGSTGMKLQKEFGTLCDEDFFKTCDAINNNAQYLSRTIDDFKNFIKGDRKKAKFNLSDELNSFLHLVDSSIKNHNINIILDLEKDIKIDGYENELTQCFINIFNNAKDILVEKEIEDKFIFISAFIKEDDITVENSNLQTRVIIKVKDNAGGISEDIIMSP